MVILPGIINNFKAKLKRRWALQRGNPSGNRLLIKRKKEELQFEVPLFHYRRLLIDKRPIHYF